VDRTHRNQPRREKIHSLRHVSASVDLHESDMEVSIANLGQSDNTELISTLYECPTSTATKAKLAKAE